MKIIIFGLILIFLAYELFIKDAFGFKRVFVNHLTGFDHKIYGALISVVIPFFTSASVSRDSCTHREKS